MLMFNLVNNYRKQRRDCDADEFLDFAEEEMRKFNLDKVAMQTVDQEKCDLWYDMKIGRISASKIYEIVRSRWSSNIVRRLQNHILGNSPNNFSSSAMQRGLRLQDEVMKVASMILKKPLSRVGLLLDAEHPAIGASPDAVGPDFIVEIKCVIDDKNVKNYLDPSKKSGLKTKYYYQILLQMHIRNVKYGYFVIAAGDFETSKKVTIVKVKYNKWCALRMIRWAMKFWKDHIFEEIWDNLYAQKK